MIRILLFLHFAFIGCCFAENVVWRGHVNADGTPSPLVELELHKTYQVRVSGFVNLGKWMQQGEKLANDACYEFNKEGSLSQVNTLRNSGDIVVCSGTYNASHIYLSPPFVAKQDRIHFWLHDTTYEDNSGELRIEIIRVGEG